MQFITDLFSFIARTLLKLALFLIGMVIALFALCIGLVVLVWVLLKALVTGRKPVFVTTFTSFRQASQFGHGMWGTGPRESGGDSASGEIIEGQVIEVRDDTALPHAPEADKKTD